jgi:hypothetical protein
MHTHPYYLDRALDQQKAKQKEDLLGGLNPPADRTWEYSNRSCSAAYKNKLEENEKGHKIIYVSS